MANKKADWSALQQFLPPNTFSFINNLLNEYPLKLIISKPRQSVLGYYKPPQKKTIQHTITVNGNLSCYAFFIILIHEIAHLKTFVAYGNRVSGHGVEWKRIYSDLLKQSLDLHCYPTDLEEAIKEQANNFASLRSCTDDKILRILKKYENTNTNNHLKTIEETGVGNYFLYKGIKFLIKEKRRTRYLCENLQTQQNYLFHSLVNVENIQ